MARRAKDEKEHCQLGWRIIELKLAYYAPEHVHPSRRADHTVEDDLYDQMEKRYLELTRKLQKAHAKKYPDEGPYPLNSVVHKGWPGYEDMLLPPHTPMMEVDFDRPSVELVMKKLSQPK